jgi:hypothetical protein
VHHEPEPQQWPIFRSPGRVIRNRGDRVLLFVGEVIMSKSEIVSAALGRFPIDAGMIERASPEHLQEAAGILLSQGNPGKAAELAPEWLAAMCRKVGLL